MSESLKTLRWLVVAAVLIIAAGSCGNDDEAVSEETEGNIPPEYALTDEDLNQFLVEELLANLCEVDTLNDSTVTYSPRFGHPDEADPTVYYIKSMGDNDAVSFFRYLLPIGAQDDVLEFGDVTTYAIADRGSISLQRFSGQDGVVARISVDFPEVPQIKELVYIPEALWPYNDSSSPFTVGSVWDRTADGKTYRYVCVKAYCGKNDNGIMMTFDGGWESEKFDGIEIYKNCASKWAWQKMSDLYTDFRTKFDNARKNGAIPNTLLYGYTFRVGNRYSKYKFVLKRHYIPYMEFNDDQFNFYEWTVDKPWYDLAVFDCEPSSHIEFGSSKPSGTWTMISF